MYVMIVSMFVLISYHKYPQSNTPIIVKVEKLKTLITSSPIVFAWRLYETYTFAQNIFDSLYRNIHALSIST